MPLILTEADIRQVLPMDDLIEAMESALVQLSAGDVTQPLRTVLSVGAEKAFFGVMPAYVPAGPALGTKLVTVFQGNPDRGLPSHLATILLLDPATGVLLALLDGGYITETRTAAVSAVSVRHLARRRVASVLCLIGSGVQAASHLEAIARVRPLSEVRVFSPHPSRRTAFADGMRARGYDTIRTTSTAEAAVRGADLIVLVTSATDPVLMDDWVDEGAHVVAVGACRPNQREMEPRLLARARLVVDSRTAAVAEAGDIVMAIEEGHIGPSHIVGELGEVAAGRLDGRTAENQITVFKSLGLAVEDVVAAALAYRRARAAGIGRDIDL